MTQAYEFKGDMIELEEEDRLCSLNCPYVLSKVSLDGDIEESKGFNKMHIYEKPDKYIVTQEGTPFHDNDFLKGVFEDDTFMGFTMESKEEKLKDFLFRQIINNDVYIE